MGAIIAGVQAFEVKQYTLLQTHARIAITVRSSMPCLLLISIFISNFTGVARWKRDRRRANCSINVLLREVFPSNMGKNANISVTAVETGHWFQEDTYRYHKTYSAYD